MGNAMLCNNIMNNGSYCHFFNKGCYNNLPTFDDNKYNNLSLTFFNNYCLEAFSDNNCKGSTSLKYCTNNTKFFYPEWKINSFSCYSNKKNHVLQTPDIIGIILLSLCILFVISIILIVLFKGYKCLARSAYSTNNTLQQVEPIKVDSNTINQDA